MDLQLRVGPSAAFAATAERVLGDAKERDPPIAHPAQFRRWPAGQATSVTGTPCRRWRRAACTRERPHTSNTAMARRATVHASPLVIACWALNLQYGVAGVMNFAFIMFQAMGAYIAAVLTLGPSTGAAYQQYILGASLPFQSGSLDVLCPR